MPFEPADVVVRHAGPDDLIVVLSIHTRQGNRSSGPPSELESATWSTMMSSPSLTVYIAELHGEPTGMASLMLMPNLTYACAPTAFIEGVVVLAEKRRLGIATAMLRVAVSDAALAGVDKLQLLAHKRHATDGAHALYESLGFTAEAEGFRLYLRAGHSPV